MQMRVFCMMLPRRPALSLIVCTIAIIAAGVLFSITATIPFCYRCYCCKLFFMKLLVLFVVVIGLMTAMVLITNITTKVVLDPSRQANF